MRKSAFNIGSFLGLMILVVSIMPVFAVDRDLSREATIKESIAAHKIAKKAFHAQVVTVLEKVAIPMLAGSRQLNEQAKAIRAEVEQYCIDANATEAQADSVLALTDNHLSSAALEDKQQSLEILKAVIILTAESITNEAIDPNLLDY